MGQQHLQTLLMAMVSSEMDGRGACVQHRYNRSEEESPAGGAGWWGCTGEEEKELDTQKKWKHRGNGEMRGCNGLGRGPEEWDVFPCSPLEHSAPVASTTLPAPDRLHTQSFPVCEIWILGCLHSSRLFGSP